MPDPMAVSERFTLNAYRKMSRNASWLSSFMAKQMGSSYNNQRFLRLRCSRMLCYKCRRRYVIGSSRFDTSATDLLKTRSLRDCNEESYDTLDCYQKHITNTSRLHGSILESIAIGGESPRLNGFNMVEVIIAISRNCSRRMNRF